MWKFQLSIFDFLPSSSPYLPQDIKHLAWQIIKRETLRDRIQFSNGNQNIWFTSKLRFFTGTWDWLEIVLSLQNTTLFPQREMDFCWEHRRIRDGISMGVNFQKSQVYMLANIIALSWHQQLVEITHRAILFCPVTLDLTSFAPHQVSHI